MYKHTYMYTHPWPSNPPIFPPPNRRPCHPSITNGYFKCSSKLRPNVAFDKRTYVLASTHQCPRDTVYT